MLVNTLGMPGIMGFGRRKRGYTLMEILLALAVVGGVIAGAGVLFTQTQGSANLNTAKQQLTSLSASIRELYAGSSSYTGLSGSDLITAGAVPATMVSGSNIVDAWGNTVTVASPGATTFSIAVTALDQEDCTKLSTSAFGDFVSLTIDANAAHTAAVTFATASGECTDGSGITWVLN